MHVTMCLWSRPSLFASKFYCHSNHFLAPAWLVACRFVLPAGSHSVPQAFPAISSSLSCIAHHWTTAGAEHFITAACGEKQTQTTGWAKGLKKRSPISVGYPTDYPTQPGAFWSTLLRLLTCCFGNEVADQLSCILFKQVWISLLRFQPATISESSRLASRFQQKSVQGHLPEKNVKSRQKISDPSSTRAGSFLLFLRYIDNIPDCLLRREQLQWGVSFMCAGEFCHLSASHSDCSLFFALSGCRLPFLFPLLFSFPFGLFPPLSPYFLPFSVSPIFRANNLSWSHR